MTTYEQYQAMLRVNKHRLDDELELQAQIMEEISTATTKYNARMLEAKQDLDRVDGRITSELKEEDPKMTVNEIAGKLKRDPERRQAWEKYLNCLSDHSKWAGLQEAWKQKGYSIKTLADLYAAQYFQLSSAQVRDRATRPTSSALVQESSRERLREASVELPSRRTRRSMTDD